MGNKLIPFEPITVAVCDECQTYLEVNLYGLCAKCHVKEY